MNQAFDVEGEHPVQVDLVIEQWCSLRKRIYVSDRVARLAWAEYAAQGHGRQSLTDIDRRMGFGIGEIVNLLADAVERGSQ